MKGRPPTGSAQGARPSASTFLLALAALWVSVGCQAPISVDRIDPRAPESPRRAYEARLAEQLGRDHESRDAAVRNLEALQRLSTGVSAGEADAVALHNFLVARLVEDLARTGLPLAPQVVRLSGQSASYDLEVRPGPDMTVPGATMFSADTLVFSGRYAETRCLREGVGSPFVYVIPEDAGGQEAGQEADVIRYHPVTAHVTFRGNRPVLEFFDPYEVESVSMGRNSLILAADFGAPLSLMLSTERIDKLGLARLLRPSRYDDTARLSRTQRYDPEKIPVLFVHGLQDTPATWAPMYFQLLNDPEIRERYQFWVYSYPSGYPYPYSASLLREELDRMRRLYPDAPDMVMVGHSMGGLITRVMVTDAGDSLWRAAFGASPEETAIIGRSRDLLEEALVFDARPEVDRAIFICAPHGGSILASNWIGSIATRLVKLPRFMADTKNMMVSAMTLDGSGIILQRFPNSIDTLRPDNRFLVGVSRLPIHEGIPYHSVMGDRGQGDTPDSSDGVVAYWSSHLEGVDSEKIVPSDHGGHQHPEGIAEVRRILRLHAGLPATP